MIDVDDFVRFCRRTIDGTRSAVDRIGDSRINTQPDLTGGSTPFQLVTHAFSAAEWWCAHIVCGYPSDRVRRDYAAAAAEQRDALRMGIRSSGADHLLLRTDSDWVMDLARHVSRRRHRAEVMAQRAPR